MTQTIKIISIIIIAILVVVGTISLIVISMDASGTKIADTAKLAILPPDSPEPAAGICADAPQKTNDVLLVIHEEGAFPRCQQINSDQVVIIRNDTDKDFSFSLGKNKDFSSIVLSHKEYRFPVTAGELLAPGVHEVSMINAPYLKIELRLIGDNNMPVSGKRVSGEGVSGVCAQVITRARNISTGEENDFSTPCDVPIGWEKAL